ncbi:MAG TPA: hypothetical protein VFD26_09945, partial [Methyloceanibacter sp.]|nr:hypothetical protein [Methyloceanibacter sp.]
MQSKVAYLGFLGGIVAGLVTFDAAKAQTASAEDVVSPLVATPIASPNPVLGSDDRTHLAYEIVLVNMSSDTVA